jgi:RNA polymerase sigma-70 factor (ECF subfamily)
MSIAHEPEVVSACTTDFDALYRRLWPRLMHHVLKTAGPRDAEEITQETFVRGFRSLDLSRSEGETWVWLTQVARNVAIDVARRRRHCEVTAELAEVLELRPSHLPEPAALAAEKAQILRTALAGLPEAQRTMVLLHELEGRSLREIADIMCLSEACVRKSLQRVRRKLAHRLQVLRGPAALVLPLVAVQRFAARLRPARPMSLAASVAGAVVLGTLGFGSLPGYAHSPASTQTVRLSTAANVSAEVSRGITQSVSPADRASSGLARTAPSASKLITVPDTALSPGHHTGLKLRLRTPVGTVTVEQDLDTDPSGGIVCNSPVGDCR